MKIKSKYAVVQRNETINIYLYKTKPSIKIYKEGLYENVNIEIENSVMKFVGDRINFTNICIIDDFTPPKVKKLLKKS